MQVKGTKIWLDRINMVWSIVQMSIKNANTNRDSNINTKTKAIENLLNLQFFSRKKYYFRGKFHLSVPEILQFFWRNNIQNTLILGSWWEYRLNMFLKPSIVYPNHRHEICQIFYTSIYPNIWKFTRRKCVNRDISSPLVWQSSISIPKIRIMSQSFTCRITQYFIIGLHDWIIPKTKMIPA